MQEVKVPDIGDFKDVPVIEVFVKPGDTVKADDPLVTLESDKATVDVPVLGKEMFQVDRFGLFTGFAGGSSCRAEPALARFRCGRRSPRRLHAPDRLSSTNDSPTLAERKKMKRTAFPGTDTWNESILSTVSLSPAGVLTSRSGEGSLARGESPAKAARARRPCSAPTTGPVTRGSAVSA